METKEWQHFMETGSIKDYLAYKEAVTDQKENEKGEKTVKHAGICERDRDDFTGPSHGRI
jgi:hypothetical protein